MATDMIRQPLLQESSAPPDQLPIKITPKKRRFRRCRSAPSADTHSDFSPPVGSFPGSERFSGETGPSLRQVVAFLVVYLGTATVCFSVVQNQIGGTKTVGLIDSLYFCIVTMTTVGYGDLVPKSVSAKLIACFFVFTGMALVGFLLSKAANYFVEKQEALLARALRLPGEAQESRVMKEIGANRAKYKFLTTAVFLALLMAVGEVFLWKVEKLSPVDAFYCVCSTITTLGYGDKSFSTLGGRVFAIIWILTSTICLAQFFLYLAEWKTESSQQLLAEWVLNRRMTFVDLEVADMDQDGAVGAAEFIIYKLKEMGKITGEDIAQVMEEFEDLDVDHSGALTPGDLLLSRSSS
ncbi:unnamed protein product [Spirodela intermedia]|uniref:Potassium channel domain-containing protein n=2 Tax=Spirodela intermedia TaxID=51605 RepID=A0A7I8IIZ1_SPIIN|nr:unnamed protein product [Spirodela intermedia]CAA6657319.1 unnamed protein product [Spirodela intermedia]CAA7393367.1 unnamed protein product [Spirodela intermedia]